MPSSTSRRAPLVNGRRRNHVISDKNRSKRDREKESKDRDIDSSEAETDKMEGMTDESDLNKLALANEEDDIEAEVDEEVKEEDGIDSKRKREEDGLEDETLIKKSKIDIKQEGGDAEGEPLASVAVDGIADGQVGTETQAEEGAGLDGDVEEEEGDDEGEAGDREADGEEEDEEVNVDGDAEGEGDKGNDEESKEEEDEENEEDEEDNEEEEELEEEEEEEEEDNSKRLEALESLKEIEVEYARLKDLVFETQIKTLEFELKLCEEEKHPEYLNFVKIIEDNFQAKSQKFYNYKKYKLKSIDNETRGKRVSIHQQFIKDCQDLKNKEIGEITGNWYEINKERRNMDNLTLQLPEYYQYNHSLKNIASTNSNNNPNNELIKQEQLSQLVNQRNMNYLELSYIKNIQKNLHSMPSSLNDLNSCTNDEILSDLIQLRRR